jgi:hypothetical protein
VNAVNALDEQPTPPPTTRARTLARLILAGAMIFAGFSHLFWAREEFQAQVPNWVPNDADWVVMASGGVEIKLGVVQTVLLRDRVQVGRHGYAPGVHALADLAAHLVHGRARPVRRALRARPQHDLPVRRCRRGEPAGDRPGPDDGHPFVHPCPLVR